MESGQDGMAQLIQSTQAPLPEQMQDSMLEPRQQPAWNPVLGPTVPSATVMGSVEPVPVGEPIEQVLEPVIESAIESVMQPVLPDLPVLPVLPVQALPLQPVEQEYIYDTPLVSEPDSLQETASARTTLTPANMGMAGALADELAAADANTYASSVDDGLATPASMESSGVLVSLESLPSSAPDRHQHLDEHDSLVTVRLSEPPALTIDTSAVESDATLYGPGSGPRSAMPTVEEDEEDNVDWEQLQRTEDEESNGQGAENTAMLLARLEQENAKLATNPKTAKVYGSELQRQLPGPNDELPSPRRARPPSMAQLRDMVNGPTPSALRYSMLPPPPMTDLEFYAALVQDYHQTAARLPTLLANKIRKGIPPPLRGVVWQGMTGAARDADLAARFDRFCDATSPYEGLIGKDLGRSFPGVEMFREPDGDGQRMLGRVLKSYSLHDRRIGYCQGLAFLVGPLLMHMPDREAFCVLVKLMENYDLRSSYTPDLAGLHVRIYQFRELLRTTLPELSSHLDDLQVDPASYVSQWFLSFFAVTCPLPMLFRMFDVVFAEGAAETIMRVALSLMQKNQERLLACAELEDAIQLLLSRGLWDCYHYNADEFVNHFLGLSSVVSRDRLASLEQAYREAQIANTNQTGNANVDRSSTIAAVASRFLGRLWVSSSSSFSLSSPPVTATAASFPATATSLAPSSASSASSASSPSSTSQADAATTAAAAAAGSNSSLAGTLSSGLSAAPLRPLSMLRRSTSKQSLASTVNSMEASASITTSTTSSTSSSSSSVLSSASTDATSLSRDSASDMSTPLRKSTATLLNGVSSGANGSKQSENERYLNSQIEDLLTALSDLQRQHALLADQLQHEREDRDEDRKTVRTMLQTFREKTATPESESPPPPEPEPQQTEPPEQAVNNDMINMNNGMTPDNGVVYQEPYAAYQQYYYYQMAQPVVPVVEVVPEPQPLPQPLPVADPSITHEELYTVLVPVTERFGSEDSESDNRRSSIPQSKTQLRDELTRAKEQLAIELAKGQDQKRREYELEQEVATIKDQLRDSHSHGRSLHQDKQRLEKTIHDMRSRVATSASAGPPATGTVTTGVIVGSPGAMAGGIADVASEWLVRATGVGAGGSGSTGNTGNSGGNGGSGGGGLRELKLGRSKSTPTQGSASGGLAPGPGSAKRTSSLIVSSDRSDDGSTDHQQDALVIELVQAKTAEAVARQEAEEAKQRLESLRKALGLSPSDMATVLQNSGSASSSGVAAAAASAAMGILGRLTSGNASTQSSASTADAAAGKAGAGPPAAAAASGAANTSGYGGFFGWRR